MRRGISLLLDKHIFEDHIYDIDDVKNVILEIKNYLQINTFVLIPYYNKKILSSLIFALVCGKEIYVKFEKIETLKEMLGKTRRKNALDFTDFMNFFEWQRGDIKVSKKIRLEKIKLKYKEQVLGYLFISLNAIARNKLKEKKCVDLFEQLKIIIKLSLQTKASNDDGIKNKINEKIENYFKKNDFSKDAISLGRIEKK